MDVKLLYLIWNGRPFIYDFKMSYICTGRIFLILYSIPLCHTLTKAWAIFRNAVEQYFFWLKACLIAETIRWTCFVVSWFSWKRNWWSGIILPLVRNDFLNFWCRLFLEVGSRLIGWYYATCVGSFAGFATVIITGVLHMFGKLPTPVIASKILIKCLIAWRGSVILSWPHAF